MERLTLDGVDVRTALRSFLPVGGDWNPREEGPPAEDGEKTGGAAGGGTGDSVPFWKEHSSEKRNGEVLPGLVGVTQRGSLFGWTPGKKKMIN